MLDGREETGAQVSEVPAEEQPHLESDNSDERRASLNRLLFPKQFEEFNEFRRKYGNTEALTDTTFFYGLTEGEEKVVHYFPEDSTDRADLKQVVVRLDAVGEPDEKGMRNVVLNVNGQIRPMKVRDENAESTVATVEKADPPTRATSQHHLLAWSTPPPSLATRLRPAIKSPSSRR